MDYNTERSLLVLRAVDEVLMDYIQRLEKIEGSGLYHGRAVALAVESLIKVLEDQ